MQSKISLILVFILIILFSGYCNSEPLMSEDEVSKLFGRSLEMNTPEEIEKFRVLCEAGERAYPALAEVLLDDKSDSDRISNVISVFIQSKGDKTIPLKAMSRYIELRVAEKNMNQDICEVFAALGAIGDVDEARILRKFLDWDDPLIRNSAEGNLKIIEKRLEADKRRASSRVRPGNSKVDEITRGADNETIDPNRRNMVLALGQPYWKWVFGGIMVLIVFVLFRLSTKQPSGK